MQIENYVDADLLEKFEFRNYGHALEILHDAFPIEWSEVQECLRKLRLTVADIKKAGGNESPIPKKFDEILAPIPKLSLFFSESTGKKSMSNFELNCFISVSDIFFSKKYCSP